MFRASPSVAECFPTEVGCALKFECAVKAEAWRLKSLFTDATLIHILHGLYKYFEMTRGRVCPSLEHTPARMWMCSVVITCCTAEWPNPRMPHSVRALVAFCTAQFAIAKLHHPLSLSLQEATAALLSRNDAAARHFMSGA